MTVALSVIVPTIGRATLSATLDSIYEQKGPHDEVICVADDAQGGARDAWAHAIRWRDRPSFHFCTLTAGDRGNTARNHALTLAGGTHVCFLDDDDTYLPGALHAMQVAANGTLVVFKMDSTVNGNGIVWKTPELRFCNLGTPCLLAPNLAEHPDWRPHLGDSGADFAYAQQVADRVGVNWDPTLVAVVRPHERHVTSVHSDP